MSSDTETTEHSQEAVVRLAAEVVASYLSNNTVTPSAIPDIIRTVHASLSSLGKPETAAAPVERQRPAVPIAKSVQTDYIVCLEDGKRLKMLKRYLRSRYDLSPDEYRRKWGLAIDYPMVAPAYANRRSEFAKQIGLGRGVRRAPA